LLLLRLRRIRPLELLAIIALVAVYIVLPWTAIVILWRRGRWIGVAGLVGWIGFAVFVAIGFFNDIGNH
jgi:hypothetical protein